MPRKPIDYSKTMIYKIVSVDLDIKDIYVGHTTDFKRRKSEHKRTCTNASKNQVLYEFIRSHGGWSCFDMILIEERACTNRYEAEKLERHYIESLNAKLNQVIPTRTDREYKADCREEIADKAKLYRETYKADIAQKRRLWSEDNKELVSQRSKAHYQSNKEKIVTKQKLAYDVNKEYIRAKRKETYTCACGSTCRVVGKTIHEHSNKHQAFIANSETPSPIENIDGIQTTL